MHYCLRDQYFSGCYIATTLFLSSLHSNSPSPLLLSLSVVEKKQVKRTKIIEKLYPWGREEGVHTVQAHTVFYLLVSFHPPHNSIRYTVSNSIFKLGNWGLEKLNNLPKVIHLRSKRASIRIQGLFDIKAMLLSTIQRYKLMNLFQLTYNKKLYTKSWKSSIIWT